MKQLPARSGWTPLAPEAATVGSVRHVRPGENFLAQPLVPLAAARPEFDIAYRGINISAGTELFSAELFEGGRQLYCHDRTQPNGNVLGRNYYCLDDENGEGRFGTFLTPSAARRPRSRRSRWSIAAASRSAVSLHRDRLRRCQRHPLHRPSVRLARPEEAARHLPGRRRPQGRARSGAPALQTRPRRAPGADGHPRHRDRGGCVRRRRRGPSGRQAAAPGLFAMRVR